MTLKLVASIAGAGVVIALASASVAAAPEAAPPGNAAKGKTLFARCAACHKVVPGQTGLGPNLAGVVGRPAGKLPGYNYSAAMKASTIRWNDASLSSFIAAPTKVVPGTKMMAPPITNPQDRADIIAYLKTTGGSKK